MFFFGKFYENNSFEFYQVTPDNLIKLVKILFTSNKTNQYQNLKKLKFFRNTGVTPDTPDTEFFEI